MIRVFRRPATRTSGVRSRKATRWSSSSPSSPPRTPTAWASASPRPPRSTRRPVPPAMMSARFSFTVPPPAFGCSVSTPTCLPRPCQAIKRLNEDPWPKLLNETVYNKAMEQAKKLSLALEVLNCGAGTNQEITRASDPRLAPEIIVRPSASRILQSRLLQRQDRPSAGGRGGSHAHHPQASRRLPQERGHALLGLGPGPRRCPWRALSSLLAIPRPPTPRPRTPRRRSKTRSKSSSNS